MSGKTTGLSALEMRKQLLLVESELNRAHLVNELREVKIGVHHLAGQASALASLISDAQQLGTSFAGVFRGFAGQNKNDDGKKTTWLSKFFNGARAGISLWTMLWPDRR